MREKYIEQVKRNLVVSRKRKKEIARDLQEAFDSAVEHGETEQQVIERLGSPADFADSIHEQFGIKRIEKRNRMKEFQIGIALAVAVCALAVGFFVKRLRVPGDVIGQVDAMTNIQISGSAINPFMLFMGIGVMALIAAIALIVSYSCKK